MGKTLVIPVGMPGCGKSTYFETEFSLKGFEVNVRISPDEIREELCGDMSEQGRNGDVFQIAHQRLREALSGEGGEMVYFDATNLTSDARFELHRIARETGSEVEVIFFDVKPDVCRERNRNRDRVVPEPAMDKMTRRFYQTAQDLLFEGFDWILVVRN